jgi:hypothetical protein
MNKRYKFIRGHPFDGLEDYFSAPDIRMKNTKLIYPIPQQMAFLGYDYQLKLKENLGFFFEILCQGIYGGKLKHREPLTSQLNLFTGGEEVICPDLLCGKGKYKEVKGVAKGQTLKLLDKQMKKYSSMLANGDNSHHTEIRFEIFRHGVLNLLSTFRKKPLEELVGAISSNTKFMLSIPPQIAFSIYDGGPYTSKYTGDRWDRCSQFLSNGINSLLAYPDETLTQLGVNPKDFKIRKMRFPAGVKMNNFEINPFPILVIKDKNYARWLKNFNNQEKAESEQTPIDNNSVSLPF